MTDIKQHLPLILATLRRHIAETSTPEAIRTGLRDLLPASYGLGAGCLVSEQGERSQPFDLVIYDTTLAPVHADAQEGLYDLRRALAVIVLAQTPDEQAVRTLLRTIASAKMLRAPENGQPRARIGQQEAQRSASRLKKLLPLGIVAFQQLQTPQTAEVEELALRLDALLKEQEERLRPDYLLARAQGVFYAHPALNGAAFTPYTVNIAREPALKKPHPCYVCKQPYVYPHFFYRYLCLSCGDLNYRKRAISVDLAGRIALVTGARVKIGYATALRLLRAGAHVIATTRFPHDAAQRYSREPDFSAWQDRLHIYGLDFRYLPVLERFVQHMHLTYPALDILINNAAQTVRRALEYYAPLLPYEQLELEALPPAQQTLVRRSHEALPPTPWSVPGGSEFSLPASIAAAQLPAGALPWSQQAMPSVPLDQTPVLSTVPGEFRPEDRANSWTLPFNQIDLTEFLEVQTINVTTPFLLVSHLHPLLCRSSFTPRFIINVSAIEGQFARSKQGTHVHTNMAKAALNMLTHTAAAQLARDGILMNSVDPGWISQQAPQSDPQRWERLQQLLPLDLVDAAARICDPIFTSIASGVFSSGGFYKDYQPTSW
ncbi:MAG TPA: SDR family NAD(P)-dependent oxidoreductase [Ktedonobacteraceae bacterium]|nr:SDR family NAD(P)-dependent oxidoreductase [Ktedonobacteraceae bacterium]